MNITSSFKIGYISKSRGLKGEVTIIFSEAIAPDAGDVLFLEMNGALVPYTIESISSRPDKSFVKFEDINSVQAAESLKGVSLYAPKDARPVLKKGTFYNDEILGFSVEDKTFGKIGEVIDVLESGASRLVQLRNRDGKEILIPVEGPFIVGIVRSKKLMKVDLPDGFLDI